ncbi:MAG: outer membrane lipoprotein-sorting protein [Halioglobus sp.]|jgi:outer membrane lipoprotein-sorting protein
MVMVLLQSLAATAVAPSADDIIRRAVDHFRGETSYSELTMIIHRPDWQRQMTLRAWTEGDEHTLVRVTEPKKDAGNGTLSVEGNMWTYTPKINRVIKVPSSMMSQNWMGSDFSNKDVSKDTDIVDQYDHTLIERREHEGHTVYVIQSVPHEEAAVVWGREVLHVRDDWVLLEQQFWDQDDVLVKRMRALEVEEMDGRMVASVLRMAREETPDEWTELRTLSVDFDVDLPDSLFTLSNLRNPRQ